MGIMRINDSKHNKKWQNTQKNNEYQNTEVTRSYIHYSTNYS